MGRKSPSGRGPKSPGRRVEDGSPSPSKRSRSGSSESSRSSSEPAPRKRTRQLSPDKKGGHKRRRPTTSLPLTPDAEEVRRRCGPEYIPHAADVKRRIAELCAQPPSRQPPGEAELMEERLLFYDVAVLILRSWKLNGESLLEERYLSTLLQRVRPVLLAQPMLVPVRAPVNVCGDIHGQIHDLMEIFKVGGIPDFSEIFEERNNLTTLEETTRVNESYVSNPEAREENSSSGGKHNYLFLGDYVDRGKYGSEVITVLLTFKYLFPNRVFILRGNHETDSVCRIYGFFDECKRRFSVKLFKEFTNVFNVLPIAADLEGVALCMHGGLSPELQDLRQIRNIGRPLLVGDSGLACDLLWSDPDENPRSRGWSPNERGVSFTFSAEIVDKVLAKLDKDIIIRAHQVVEKGYSFFGSNRGLVTVFSASNYCGEFTNSGAMLCMDKDCKCSFKIFKPVY